jgi:predicted nucleotidyltransferase
MASNFLEILNQLHDHHVDFVIVGGVAASLHGGSRVTFDLDVVPSLEPDSWRAAVDFLWGLGTRPRIPESQERIRDVEHIRRWRQEKGMLALNFRAPDGSTEVDLLVGESDGFEQLRQRAVCVTVDDRTFFVASIEDLIAMKQRAGRPQDLLDIAELQAIRERLGEPDR